MTLIDHLSVGVPDIEAARAFYVPVLAILGCDCLATTSRFAAYGRTAPEFLVMTPYDLKAATVGNGTHIAFTATGRDRVDAFHAAALAAGGRDAGAPGPRPDYPDMDVYTAYVRDPFGNKLEVIHNGFSA